MNTHTPVTLELNAAIPCTKVIQAHQWDNQSRYIDVQLTDNDVIVGLSNSVCAVVDAVINGVIVASEQSATIDVNTNTIVIALSEVMLSIPGVLKLDLKVSENNSLITAQTLMIQIAHAVIDENSRTEPYGGSIKEQLDNKVDTAFLQSNYYTSDEVDENIESSVASKADRSELAQKADKTALLAKADRTELNACEKLSNKIADILQVTDKTVNYPSIKYLERYFYTITETYSIEEVDNLLHSYEKRFISGTTTLNMNELLSDCRYYRTTSLVQNLPSDMRSSVVFIFVYTYGNFVHQLVYSLFENITPTVYSRFANTDGTTVWYPWRKANVDTSLDSLSTNAISNRAVYEGLSRKADIEGGAIAPNNTAWYAYDSTKVMTGTYQLCGDYCTLSANACFISGWVDVYYSLPVSAVAKASSIVHHGNDNYSISTNAINNISVIKITSVYGNAQPSGSVDFTITYKYR